MERLDPEKIIQAAEEERATIAEHYRPAVEWFLEHTGMERRDTVVGQLAAHLDVERTVANLVVGHLVSDDADPVQQVVRPSEGRYVGVIDHTEHQWFYAFDRYDDVEGRQRRAVCAHCVHDERSAAAVTHVTRTPHEYDIDRARLALAVHYQVDHEGRSLSNVLRDDLGVDPGDFANRHGIAGPDALTVRDVTRRVDEDPVLSPDRGDADLVPPVPDVDVEPGASLVSGTTISGNTAWHAGNDGAGSTLNADSLRGRGPQALWRLLQRTTEGRARLFDYTYEYTIQLVSYSDIVTVTVTPTRYWDAGFLTADIYPATWTIYEVRRNGNSFTTSVRYDSELLVPRISSGETFEFELKWVYDTTNTQRVTAGIHEARHASPTFIPIIT